MMKFKGTGCTIESDYYTNEVIVEMYPTEIGTIEEVIEFYRPDALLDEIDKDDIMECISVSDIHDKFNLTDIVIGLEEELLDHIMREEGESWIIDRLSESSILQIQREFKIDNLL